MMVLITYDVCITSEGGAKRLRKVSRACMNYGQRVQNSVFECVINESQFISLRAILKGIIEPNEDSIRFYFLGNNWPRRIEMMGKVTSFDVTDTLII